MNDFTVFKKIADKYPILTKEQELDLITKYKNGNDKEKENALNVLVMSNIRLIINCSRKFINKSNGIDLSDLIQEGVIGFQKAVDKFDLSRDLKLSTYATYWVFQSITRYIKCNMKTIRIPEHLTNMIPQIAKFEREYVQVNNHQPTVLEISKGTNIPVDTIKHIKTVSQQIISLQTHLGEDDAEIGDLIADSTTLSAVDNTNNTVYSEYLDKIFEDLTDRERIVVNFRYGVGDRKKFSITNCATLFNVNTDKIEKIRKKVQSELKLTANCS